MGDDVEEEDILYLHSFSLVRDGNSECEVIDGVGLSMSSFRLDIFFSLICYPRQADLH